MTKEKLDAYNQLFVNVVEDEKFLQRLNELKISARPMRTGKNYSERSFRIPYLFKTPKHDLKLQIATSPLKGIILENEEALEDLCTINGWKYETDPEKVIRNIEKGFKTITYQTNQKAFTYDEMTIDFFNELLKLNVLPKTSINIDEMDTWTLSHASKGAEVKGYELKENKYRASMYRFVQKLAKHTPYTFGMTATPSYEVKGIVDTYGNLKYTLLNPLIEGEQKQYANMVAHIGNTHFYSFANTAFGETDDIEKTVGIMMKERFRIENLTRLKRVAMIQCGIDTQDEKGWGKSPNPTEALKFIQKFPEYITDKEKVGFVLTSDEKYLFDINGNKVQDLSESQIYRFTNDLQHPARFLIVKDMAGRGITLPTIKEVMTLKIRDAKSKHGAVTEPAEQFVGRAKSLYVGESQSKFWTDYKSIANVPGYQELANTYNYYAPDTPMYKAADKTHRKYDACTLEMSDIQIELCHECGQPLPRHIRTIDEDFSGIDNVLKMRKGKIA